MLEQLQLPVPDLLTNQSIDVDGLPGNYLLFVSLAFLASNNDKTSILFYCQYGEAWY